MATLLGRTVAELEETLTLRELMDWVAYEQGQVQTPQRDWSSMSKTDIAKAFGISHE